MLEAALKSSKSAKSPGKQSANGTTSSTTKGTTTTGAAAVKSTVSSLPSRLPLVPLPFTAVSNLLLDARPIGGIQRPTKPPSHPVLAAASVPDNAGGPAPVLVQTVVCPSIVASAAPEPLLSNPFPTVVRTPLPTTAGVVTETPKLPPGTQITVTRPSLPQVMPITAASVITAGTPLRMQPPPLLTQQQPQLVRAVWMPQASSPANIRIPTPNNCAKYMVGMRPCHLCQRFVKESNWVLHLAQAHNVFPN